MVKRKQNVLNEENKEEKEEMEELSNDNSEVHKSHSKKQRRRRNKKELSLMSLPNDILLNILSFLDPFSICNLRLVNRFWNKVVNDEKIWKLNLEKYMTFYNWNASIQGEILNKKNSKISWKEYFLNIAKHFCVDCGKETKAKLLGNISVPFCSDCREGYAITRNGQNFIPKSKAKSDFSLNEKELKTLKYGFCTNPINSQWNPMNLFWKYQIEGLAINKFHSLKEMKEKQKERRLRRELSSN